jgi:acyl-CoA synthetase (AMP-forming)/AMP-acid ligase II
VVLVSDIVRKNAEYFGPRDAVVAPDTRTASWAELDERTDRLAKVLQRLGLTKGDRLAMFAPNCVEYVEFFFACAKSGVIGAPLNLRLSPAELTAYVNYVEPAAVLVHADEAEAARAWLAAVSSVNHAIGFGGDHGFDLDLERLLVAEDTGSPPTYATAVDPYMLCPTSGTTGRPKAAVLTQGNAISAIFGWLADYPVVEGDTNLQCIPQYLNAGGPSHIHPVFLKGGRSVLLPRFNAESFLRCVSQYGVTHTVAVPTMISAVLAHPDVAATNTSSLRCVVLGGAPLTRELVLATRESLGDCLYPTLGMAETFSCGLVLAPHNQHPDGTPAQLKQLGSLGRPHSHLLARIVDANDQDVPRDGTTPGEVLLRGDCISACYFELPDETAAAHRGEWLHTGDLAVIDAQGFITVVDRLKDIIITGGYNVASVEVEAVLGSHPGVEECAVVGRPHPVWGEAVHAIVVATAGVPVTEAELVEHLRGHLARYKHPRSFSFTDKLPRNSTGKVLKRQLRAEIAVAHDQLGSELG